MDDHNYGVILGALNSTKIPQILGEERMERTFPESHFGMLGV